MEHCQKYDLEITDCSKQTSLFKPEICVECLEAYRAIANKLKAKKPPVAKEPISFSLEPVGTVNRFEKVNALESKSL